MNANPKIREIQVKVFHPQDHRQVTELTSYLMLNNQRGFTLLEFNCSFHFHDCFLIMTKALHSVLGTQAATEKHAEVTCPNANGGAHFSRDLEQAIDRPITAQEGTIEAAFLEIKHCEFTHSAFKSKR